MGQPESALVKLKRASEMATETSGKLHFFQRRGGDRGEVELALLHALVLRDAANLANNPEEANELRERASAQDGLVEQFLMNVGPLDPAPRNHGAGNCG